MKFSFRILAVFTMMCTLQVQGQQVRTSDTVSGTPVTISMDAKIQKTLADLEEKCELMEKAKDDAEYTRTTPRVVNNTPSRPLSRAELCRQNPRILGYKIQIAVVKSNAEANQVKANFRNRFPGIKVETDASLRPNYKILAGSYLSKQSAASDLSRIRSAFRSAVAVQYRVFCVEAK